MIANCCRLSIVLLVAVAVTACASPPPVVTPIASGVDSRSSEQLWSELTVAASPREIMLIEAELASRGQTSSGNEYLGRRTSVGVGVASYQRRKSSVADKDCSDFASSAQAQKFFLSQGGPSADPHGLDRDGDGYVCEFGTALVRNAAAKTFRPAVVSKPPAARVMASEQCFTGPRGGTYTLTASGRKNYDGC
ncbi:Excalibur calcium-binding domain-containing protein [Rhizobium sp. NFR03]|nr:Excalibur calcium-binding domain-containing protein [Rhizobium sp. NFR03]